MISFAYASVSPSLYTLIEYITISPFLTCTGSFECVYIAVVDVLSINGFTSTCGSLFCFSPFTVWIYFLNAKSNTISGFSTVTFSKSSSSSCPL